MMTVWSHIQALNPSKRAELGKREAKTRRKTSTLTELLMKIKSRMALQRTRQQFNVCIYRQVKLRWWFFKQTNDWNHKKNWHKVRRNSRSWNPKYSIQNPQPTRNRNDRLCRRCCTRASLRNRLIQIDAWRSIDCTTKIEQIPWQKILLLKSQHLVDRCFRNAYSGRNALLPWLPLLHF